MNRNRAIQFKAIFLLVVFALNTLVGFACSVGLDMGFNAKHHHEKDAVAVAAHHHESVAHHHHHQETTEAKHHAGEHDNCCNDGVIKFSQLDKLLAHAVNAGVEMPVMLVQIHFIYQSFLSVFTLSHEHIQVARPFVLSSRGIRVSIQSFQI